LLTAGKTQAQKLRGVHSPPKSRDEAEETLNKIHPTKYIIPFGLQSSQASTTLDMISSNTSSIFIHFTIPSNTVYSEEMAKLERTVDFVDNTKDAKSKVAYLKALVQRAVHRAVGKGKAPSKTSTSFPPSVDILTKRECLEQANVHYSRRGFKACRSSNVVISTEEQHEKEGSFSISDEAAFNVDVFKLVKYRIQEGKDNSYFVLVGIEVHTGVLRQNALGHI
jgi:hypothetical protein